ncbi:MAG: Holliday junction resolvase RuvX [Gammaproteobacteria bacterium]|nr:Holliday junction resolvase RuvX [Gammaproteobacteria bacterium]
MTDSAPATLLAFDFGRRRIGIAVGQTISATASPLQTVEATRDGAINWAVIEKLVVEWRPDALVVGIPSHADGSEHPLSARIQRFARQLGGRFALPVHLIDERLSSHAAEAFAGTTSRHRLDAHAAQIILETYLAENEQKQTRG